MNYIKIIKSNAPCFFKNEDAKFISNELMEMNREERKSLCGAYGYYEENQMFYAFDNRTSDFWFEEFETEKEAINWINE